jgi:tetratricopeptide (TPR) repeat protein
MNLDQLAREAEALQKAGRIDEAEALYRRLLAQAPECGEIHFMLGCLYVRSGRPSDALPTLIEAARLLPHLSEAQIVLGNVLISQTRWAEAVEALTRAVALRPDLIPAKINLALALYASGRNAEAEALYREILQVEPDNLQALCTLAYGLNEQRLFQEALPYARRAVQAAPGNASALHILGNSLMGLSRLAEAEETFCGALAIAPTLPHLHLSLFTALRRQDRYAEAEQAARRALQLAPNHATALDSVGMALIDLERLDEAADLFRRALQLNPQSAPVAQHLAEAYSRMGLLEEAVSCAQRSVDLDPTPETRHLLSHHQLRTGRFHEGWANIRSGESWAEEWKRQAGPPPRWDGSPLDGRALLVHADGGIGDTIQLARYLPLVNERANGSAVFQCQPGLIDLFCGMPGLDNVILQAVEYSLEKPEYVPPPAPVDFYISMLGLPAIFSRTEEEIPSGLLPLQIPDEAAAAWRGRLAQVEGLKVGLCWAGSPRYVDDRYRSTHLENFTLLAEIEGLSLVSLQFGPRADEIEPLRRTLNILHLPDGLQTMPQTAALIRELDLVISVDTSIAHLAGALGVETWLLLPFVFHFIWNIHHPNDTPWYPRHRLFRQPRLNDWATVIGRVAQELDARVAGSAAGRARRL